MSHFLTGFEKRAEEAPDWKRHIPGIAAGIGALGAGAVTYGLLRRGGKRLTNVMQYTRDKAIYKDHTLGIPLEPKSRLGKKFHQLIHGADDIQPGIVSSDNTVSFSKRKYDPAKEVIFNDTAMHPSKYVSGKVPAVYGNRSGSYAARGESSISNNKRMESEFINKIAPGLHAPTVPMSREHTRTSKALGKFHDGFSKKHGDYILKHVESVQSGPGGESFLSSQDIKAHLQGRGLDPKKKVILRHMVRNPEQYIAQKKHNLVRSFFTGKPVEYRVHTAGGDVLNSVSRTTHFGVGGGEAEAVAKEFVNKMPEEMRKKKTMFSMDIAKTKDGYKIIETNPGGDSGFLSPTFMAQKGFSGIPGYISAVMGRQKLYKSLAGRSSQLEAGVKGIGVAGVGGAASYGVAKKVSEPS